MNVFNSYAGFYDTLYREKDYAAECGFLEEIFTKHADRPIKNILDVGCGTGGHSILLSKRKYRVSGIDLSDKMLEQAKNKARQESLDIDFQQRDVRDFDLNRKFDAAVSMFAVMGYQITNQDVEKALKSVRRHLNPGGLFVFDVWYGPAVLIQQPVERVKVIDAENERIIRIAQPVMDTFRHTVRVNYTVMRVAGDRITAQSEESHLMRYFFPQELTLFLNHNGFEPLRVSPFMVLGEDVSANDWNISIVARSLS